MIKPRPVTETEIFEHFSDTERGEPQPVDETPPTQQENEDELSKVHPDNSEGGRRER